MQFIELFYGVSDKGEMVAQPFEIGYKVNKYAAAFGFAVFVVKTFDMAFDKHLFGFVHLLFYFIYLR